uniref:Metaxin glutathione S-transferase domain-containing protein n=1 Tax=Acrobeloides nanus TaxID=290746 RepID=A0A914CDX5_9BILA
MANLLKYIFATFVGPQILNRFWIKGIARHSKQELNEILRHDFIAIETILGDKKFIFGDKVHEIDCTIFGHMASFTFLPYDHEAKRILREEFPTIKNHMDRMAKMFFSESQFRE